MQKLISYSPLSPVSKAAHSRSVKAIEQKVSAKMHQKYAWPGIELPALISAEKVVTIDDGKKVINSHKDDIKFIIRRQETKAMKHHKYAFIGHIAPTRVPNF